MPNRKSRLFLTVFIKKQDRGQIHWLFGVNSSCFTIGFSVHYLVQKSRVYPPLFRCNYFHKKSRLFMENPQKPLPFFMNTALYPWNESALWVDLQKGRLGRLQRGDFSPNYFEYRLWARQEVHLRNSNAAGKLPDLSPNPEFFRRIRIIICDEEQEQLIIKYGMVPVAGDWSPSFWDHRFHFAGFSPLFHCREEKKVSSRPNNKKIIR